MKRRVVAAISVVNLLIHADSHIGTACKTINAPTNANNGDPGVYKCRKSYTQ
jgi:hypothetical protein